MEPLADEGGSEDDGQGVLALEKPDYGDLLECFLGAGVMGYPNQREFEKKRRMLENLKTRVAYFPDTNVLYHRFLSNYAGVTRSETALVETTRKEIEAALNFKYTQPQVRALKGEAKYQGHLVDGLLSRRMKNSRKAAYLALREYRDIGEKAIQVPAVGETGPEKERNDLVFARSIEAYVRGSTVYPVVLTCNGVMTDVCEVCGLDYFLFRVPRRIKGGDVPAGRFLTLLQLASGVYGFVRLNGVLVIGEYGGKRDHDEVKVFLDGERAERFRRDLEISRGLVELVKERRR